MVKLNPIDSLLIWIGIILLVGLGLFLILWVDTKLVASEMQETHKPVSIELGPECLIYRYPVANTKNVYIPSTELFIVKCPSCNKLIELMEEKLISEYEWKENI